MRVKALLINAPSQDSCDRFFGWPTSVLYAVAPSVAAAKEGRLDVEFVPAVFDPIWWVEGENDAEVATKFCEVLATGVDVICISMTYDALYPALNLLKVAREFNPEIVAILGGPHIDEVGFCGGHEKLWRSAGNDDWIVAGDGEYALLAILRAISEGVALDAKAVRGRTRIYHKNKVYLGEGDRLQLDELPLMPLELADCERHRHDFDIFVDEWGRIIPTAQMIARRGCAYSCNFCSERRELAYLNNRSLDRILAEIQARKAQGFGAIFFDDSTFGLFPRLKELLCALQGTGMVFGCLNRFNHLTKPEVVRAYREAGFRYVYCAVEQFDDQSLRSVGKAQTTRTIQRAMEVLGENGIEVGVSLLYGLPGESKRSIGATLDFTAEWVSKGTIKLVSESVLSFHPGTPTATGRRVRFDCVPPNQGFPFDRFEEGQWYHPEHVTADHLDWILEESEERFGQALVRGRHSWYQTHGLVGQLRGEEAQRRESFLPAGRPPVWPKPLAWRREGHLGAESGLLALVDSTVTS